MTSDSNLSELTRIPENMREKYNVLSAFQDVLQGNVDFKDTTNSFEEPYQSSNKFSKEKESVIPQVSSLDASRSGDSHQSSIDINRLSDLLINKLLNSFHIEPKANKNSQFTAELKLDVLSYSFKYTKFYTTDTMIIFAITDPFKLNIKEPLKLKLSVPSEAILDKPVICIGSPIELSDLNIQLLIFVDDKS